MGFPCCTRIILTHIGSFFCQFCSLVDFLKRFDVLQRAHFQTVNMVFFFIRCPYDVDNDTYALIYNFMLQLSVVFVSLLGVTYILMCPS